MLSGAGRSRFVRFPRHSQLPSLLLLVVVAFVSNRSVAQQLTQATLSVRFEIPRGSHS